MRSPNTIAGGGTSSGIHHASIEEDHSGGVVLDGEEEWSIADELGRRRWNRTFELYFHARSNCCLAAFLIDFDEGLLNNM